MDTVIKILDDNTIQKKLESEISINVDLNKFISILEKVKKTHLKNKLSEDLQERSETIKKVKI